VTYFIKYNPLILMFYYAAVIITSMFTMNPVIAGLSLCGAYIFLLTSGCPSKKREHIFYIVILIVCTLINPVFSHNGRTVLFVVNDSPITLEAAVYGLVMSVSVLSVLIWFRTFVKIMTSDKLLYVFGALSPKLELILSVALRYIPMFVTQAEKIGNTQKAIGLYRKDSITDEIKGGSRVFSVMVTWALENGIITAESMEARGYGTGRRTSFKIYRFRRSDILLAVIILVLFSVTAAALALGAHEFEYYPVISDIPDSFLALLSYSAYSVLVFLPLIIEKGESIRWKYLKSRI